MGLGLVLGLGLGLGPAYDTRFGTATSDDPECSEYSEHKDSSGCVSPRTPVSSAFGGRTERRHGVTGDTMDSGAPNDEGIPRSSVR